VIVDYCVTLIACQAQSLSLVELTAESGNFTADSIFVEVVTLRAFGALAINPGLAAEMVSDGDDVTKRDT